MDLSAQKAHKTLTSAMDVLLNIMRFTRMISNNEKIIQEHPRNPMSMSDCKVPDCLYQICPDLLLHILYGH